MVCKLDVEVNNNDGQLWKSCHNEDNSDSGFVLAFSGRDQTWHLSQKQCNAVFARCSLHLEGAGWCRLASGCQLQRSSEARFPNWVGWLEWCWPIGELERQGDKLWGAGLDDGVCGCVSPVLGSCSGPLVPVSKSTSGRKYVRIRPLAFLFRELGNQETGVRTSSVVLPLPDPTRPDRHILKRIICQVMQEVCQYRFSVSTTVMDGMKVPDRSAPQMRPASATCVDLLLLHNDLRLAGC